MNKSEIAYKKRVFTEIQIIGSEIIKVLGHDVKLACIGDSKYDYKEINNEKQNYE